MKSHIKAPQKDEERTIGGLHAYLINTFEASLDNPQRLSVLDVGCGSGVWLRRLTQLGFENLHGLDRDRPADTSGFEFSVCDLDHDCFVDDSFDMITCIEVIEHMENPGKLLDLLSSCVKDDGIIVLTTPNIESLRARLRALVSGKVPQFDEKGDPTHLFPVIERTLVKLLKPRGLRIEKCFQYPPNPKVSLMYRQGIARVVVILRLFLPDPRFGDISVYLIRKA